MSVYSIYLFSHARLDFCFDFNLALIPPPTLPDCVLLIFLLFAACLRVGDMKEMWGLLTQLITRLASPLSASPDTLS